MIKFTIWEDSSGCLKNVQKKRITLCTHHINVAYHWFWDCIGEDTGISIKKIDTTEQIADIVAKGLERSTFEIIRNYTVLLIVGTCSKEHRYTVLAHILIYRILD